MRRPNPIVPLLLAMAAAAAPAAGQSPLLQHASRTSAFFQVQRPSFNGGGSAWLVNAGAIANIGGGAQFLFEVPFVWVTESGIDKNTLLGNPYLAFRATSPSAYLELGLRAPAVGDNAAWIPAEVGMNADFDNAEAYLSNALTLAGAAGYDTPTGKDGMVTHIRAGLSDLIPTRSGGESQLLGNYMGLLGYRVATLEVDAGVTGRILLNNYGNASLAERTVHQAALGFSWQQGGVRPALFLRLPLDQDAKDMYSTVLGLGLSVDLR